MIEFRAVTKRFPDGTVAVDDFSLVIPSRKITVFVGSSGSGKTTLLRMINRMVDPTGGDIEIDGDSIMSKEPVALRRSIGYVMQNSGLLPHFKVIDNVTTVPTLNGVPKKQAREQALELLDTVGLMDEPFGAVDPIVRAELQQETISLQHELDKTIVFVTHDIDEAFLLGDQVVILEKGAKIAQVGSPNEIMAAPASDFVADFIGAERGKRALSLKKTANGTILVDSEGRGAGVLVGGSELA